MNTTISFPGLGIEEFSVSRAAFALFGREVYWYGVIIMLGMVAAFIHAYFRSKQEGIKTDDILDIGIFVVFLGVLGARLFYVFFDFLKRPENYQDFVDIIAVWDGGLAIYGGVIGGVLTVFVVSHIKKLNPFKILDIVTPGVMLAQAMGRWGNFVNGEAFGGVVPADSLLYPFRMGVSSSFTGYQMLYVHPTFLYESLWNLVGFTLITIFYRKKKFNGQVALTYFAWYGFGRMFIEGLRTDSLYIGSLRVSQLIGAACFVAGAGLMIAGLIALQKGLLDKWLKPDWAQPATANGAPAEPADEPYEPVFTTPETDTDPAVEETSNPDTTAEPAENDTHTEET